MKKIISILLVLITVLSLSACTRQIPKEEVDESKIEISDEQVLDSDFLLGSINGQTYRNEFIGLEFTADDDWKYLNHEEIAEAKNVSLEAVSGDMKEELENTDFIDLMSAEDNAGSSVSISLEKTHLNPSTFNAAENFQYLIPEMKTAYESIGADYFNYEIKKNTIDGKTMDTLVIESGINNIDLYQIFFTLPLPSYYATITMTGHSKTEAEDILDNFKWIN